MCHLYFSEHITDAIYFSSRSIPPMGWPLTHNAEYFTSYYGMLSIVHVERGVYAQAQFLTEHHTHQVERCSGMVECLASDKYVSLVPRPIKRVE